MYCYLCIQFFKLNQCMNHLLFYIFLVFFQIESLIHISMLKIKPLSSLLSFSYLILNFILNLSY